VRPWPVLVVNPSPTQLRKSAKSRPTNRPTVHGLTVDEGQQPVRGKLLIGSTSNGHNS
ncbi:hypothetical protein MTR67_043785, partial [Solanum verrucosum]